MTTSTTVLPLALRDTALSVTELRRNAQPATFKIFRARCQAQITRLRDEFREAGHAPDVVEDAVYAQCALLDEVALQHLATHERDAWAREPLQVEAFQSHDAGDVLIERIERRLAEPQPVLPLLVVFQTVLGLGFQGRFIREGDTARCALMEAIDERLTRAGLNEETGLVIVAGDKTRGWRGISAMAWVPIAMVGTALVYFALDHWLADAIVRLHG